MPLDQIFIDSLDGAEFEALCAHIYERLGYQVHNVQHTDDKGRDLILKSPEGEIIVGECKYWAGGSIGRPIVQKLHSAAISENAQRALILTTGASLTKGARDYMGGLSPALELIDMPKLNDLATRAGIALISGQTMPILCLPLFGSNSLVRQRLNEDLFNKINSSPKTPEQLLSVVWKSSKWIPVYLVQYSLKQDFSTTVGVIHKVDVSDEWIVLNGEEDGVKLPKRLAKLLGSCVHTLPEISDVFKSATSMPSEQFDLDASALKDTAKERIVKIHSKSVEYWGRNNQNYKKKCVPSKRNIYLKNSRQVYLPIQELNIQAITHQYRLTLADNGRDVCYLDYSALFTCKICDRGKKIEARALCNSCGAITHRRHCSRQCNECDKTICRKCTYWTSKWLIFRKYLCRECGIRAAARKTVYHLED
ncbi:MAG: restriction endonuclease [Chloroflexota bacterium]|nr:restriction endonuclease [Chloroflexota bacterium]